MRVLAINPAIDQASVLEGAQFIDAFRVPLAGPTIGARAASERMFARSPSWFTWLMSLRNTVMRPFGVKTPSPSRQAKSAGLIGIFPVVSEAPNQLILGFDDHHLDFRVVVEVDDAAGARCVVATTIVKTHNRLGRLYLAVIMPFHRQVVKTMLRQVNAALPSAPASRLA